MKTKHFGLMLLIAGAITFAPRDLMGDGACANNMQQGTTAPPNTGVGGTGYGDPVEAYSGNDQRPIVDLQMFAGVGTHRLAWVRYANTRYASGANYFGTGANVRHSYQWEMVPSGSGFKINYPEGAVWTFNPVSGSAGQYAATAACPDRLFQNGTSYVLQKANGSQYYFQLVGTIYEMVYFRDKYGSQYNLTYDTMGRVTQVSEPGGRSLTVSYSGSVVTKVSSSDGRVVTYNYGTVVDQTTKVSYQTLNSVVYPDGTQAQYSYAQLMSGTRPVVMSAVDPRTHVFNKLGYTYYTNKASIMGQIASQVDLASGAPINLIGLNNPSNTTCPMATEYANQGASNYWSMTEATGHPQWKSGGRGYRTYTTFDQGGYGFLNSVTDANGNTTALANSPYGNPLSRTNADASMENWTRDAQERVLSYQNPLGKTISYNRDSSGRVTNTTYPDGTSEGYTYNAFNQVLSQTLRSGYTLNYTYNSSGLVTSATDPLGNTTTYGYDSADRCNSITDALGRTTQMSYNDRGQMVQLIHPDGTSISYAYDTFGNLTNTVDECGASWSKTYDAYHQVTSSTDPLGNTTIYGYYALYHGLPNQVTLPSGKQTVMGYDTDYHMTNKTVGYGSADAATTSYTYDKVGNITKMIDGNGKIWSYAYDRRNRKISEADPLGNKTLFSYDGAGNILTVTRPGGQVTTNSYDSMNRLLKSTDALGNSSTFAYDASGNLLSFTDAKGSVYSYTYDGLNRKLSMSYPDKTSELWTYDAVGNMTTYTTRAGQVCTYTYDSRNRNTGYSWSDGTLGNSKSYDAVGRLLSQSNANAVISYTYDLAGNKLSETQTVAYQALAASSSTGSTGTNSTSTNIASTNPPAQAFTRTVNYSYDEDGNRVTLLYPDTRKVSYNYNGRNLLSGITQGVSNSIATYSYDGAGNRIAKTLGNGVVVTAAYDNASRLTGLTNALAGSTNPIAGYAYSLNSSSLRYSSKETTALFSRQNNYNYDSNNQLTNAYYGGGGIGTRNYSYDATGNRTSTSQGTTNTVVPYLVNNCNQYTQVGSLLITHDKNGNMTTDQNGNTYSYDAQNRLIKAVSKGGSNTVIMAYDPQNRVVARTINGTATYYVYDNWKLLAEYDDYGVEDAYYVHGPRADEPLTLNISTGGTSYYIQDGNGNVTTMTDTSGNVIERYAYDPFGNVTITGPTGTTQSTSSVGNRFMFSGREYIAEIKLYDFRSRVYSPGLGRFIQTDPMRFQAGDNNIYRYCGNNPISGADPMGLCGQSDSEKYANEKADDPDKANPGHGFDGQSGLSDSEREALQSADDPSRASPSASPNQGPNTNPSSPPGPTPPPAPAPNPTPVAPDSPSVTAQTPSNGGVLQTIGNIQDSLSSLSNQIFGSVGFSGALESLAPLSGAINELSMLGKIGLGDTLFARKVGLLNSNDYVRIG
jgi:RHS repeat-associated protein